MLRPMSAKPVERQQVIRAGDFKLSNRQQHLIKNAAVQILYSIKKELSKEPIDDYKTTIRYSLPTTFDIPNMSSKTLQRKIYYKVMTELEDGGFSVELVPDDQKTYLLISLYCQEEIADRDKEIQYLANRTRKQT